MRKFTWTFLVLCIVGMTGCRQERPDLKIDAKSEKAVNEVLPSGPEEHNAAQTEQDLGHNVKVVTAEPATTDEGKEGDVPTAEDKTGAVAVKMEY